MLIETLYGFRPSGQPCVETKEFNLVRNMLIAAVEERYRDAGKYVLPIEGKYLLWGEMFCDVTLVCCLLVMGLSGSP